MLVSIGLCVPSVYVHAGEGGCSGQGRVCYSSCLVSLWGQCWHRDGALAGVVLVGSVPTKAPTAMAVQ